MNIELLFKALARIIEEREGVTVEFKIEKKERED